MMESDGRVEAIFILQEGKYAIMENFRK